MHSMLKAPFFLLLMLSALCGSLSAQDTGVNGVKNEIRLLREQLDRLQQRLSEIEGRAPADPEAPAPPSSPAVIAETSRSAAPPPETSTEISGFLSSRWINTG